jgi:hypothetical protein
VRIDRNGEIKQDGFRFTSRHDGDGVVCGLTDREAASGANLAQSAP